MPKPTVLIVSQDACWAEVTAAILARTCEVQCVAQSGAALAAARQSSPWGVVFDFRGLAGGGHAEARLLDELTLQLPDPRRFAVLPANCPEVLERSITCNRFTPLSAECAGGRLHDEVVAYLAAQVRCASPGEAPGPARALPERREEAAADCESAYALTGLTRRFETNSPRLRMMLADLEVAARHDVTVLLIGETGSGKTYLSRLIHEISPRRDEPFMPLACGALPNDLIESELFGHVKGAFTSAHADKEGKFIAARKGTILLDEIDVLGLEQQVKLLRVIESGEFEPVGSNRTLKSEARLIVASNLDLQPLVEQKRFRPDLYYRLNMLKFEIPPLRARRPDIVPLARKFVQEQSARHGVKIEHIEETLFAALLRYPWPGNVRELEHVIQRAVIYSRDGTLSARHLPAHVVMCQAGPGNEGRPLDDAFEEPAGGAGSLLGRQVALSEREIIEQTLFQNNYSRTRTAKALGISRVTLYNKMKKYGMSK